MKTFYKKLCVQNKKKFQFEIGNYIFELNLHWKRKIYKRINTKVQKHINK